MKLKNLLLLIIAFALMNAFVGIIYVNVYLVGFSELLIIPTSILLIRENLKS